MQAGSFWLLEIASQLTTVECAVQSELLGARAAHAITGGTGGLGLLFAAWLAAGGARHIALWGRSGRATADVQMEHLLRGPAQASTQTTLTYNIDCMCLPSDCVRFPHVCQLTKARMCPEQTCHLTRFGFFLEAGLCIEAVLLRRSYLQCPRAYRLA